VVNTSNKVVGMINSNDIIDIYEEHSIMISSHSSTKKNIKKGKVKYVPYMKETAFTLYKSRIF
jgi:signal-transduction protein with cAMP-binding, CBS, and nucleotidyltransferase domain